MSVHIGTDLTARVIAVLTAGGLTVGDALTPSPVPAGSGYVVVYPLAGGMTDGTLAKPDDDAAPVYQVTAIGRTRQQCEWVADKARSVILAGSYPAVGGRTVMLVRADWLGGVQRDDNIQPPLFYSPDRYSFLTTPT